MSEYINISDAEISKPIYRIISFDRLVRIFQSNQMTFVKPEKWDDPFENIIAKTKIDLGTSMGSSFLELGIRKNSHGTCWTRKAISDAIWRIYSHDKKAVRIKSTPEVISRNIRKGLEIYPKSKLFIGKVEYITLDQVKTKAKEFAKRALSGESSKAAAESLLFKRNSFSHEDEARVLIIDQHDISKDGMLNIKVDPHDLIQSVVIDSRAPTELVDVYTAYLKNVLEFNGHVSKSTLYDIPKPIKVKIKSKLKAKRKIKVKRK
jgi:hypothetical protein